MTTVPNSSNSSEQVGVEGNANSSTRQPSGAKYWTFRWSNYPEDWKDGKIVPDFMQGGCVGYVIGEEICPTTGTPHLQGYAEFKTKIRWTAFKNLPKGIEWQPRARYATKRNNLDYCSKEGKFVSWGTCEIVPEYKINIELRMWQVELKNILDEEPNDRTIHWYWEPDGCQGKTTFQKWIFLNYKHKGCVVLSGKGSDMKNGVVKWSEMNEKKLPKIVLINIPRCQDTDHVSWQGIEEIKDMFFFSGKYEGGMVCGPNPHVFIFSNEEPPTCKLSQDRWNIVRINV